MSQSNHMLKTDHQKRVEEFMRRAGQDVLTQPMVPNREVRLLRAKLIFEEAMETIGALGCKVDYVLGAGSAVNLEVLLDPAVEPNLVLIADGCADISVVTIGTLSACGIADIPLLNEVDRSNLAKFGPGGYRREDGKWIKPDDWQPPNIVGVLNNQIQDDEDGE